MPVNPPQNQQPIALTALSIITSALKEIGVLSPIETPAAEDAAFGLEKLQRLTDQLNAQQDIIFAHEFDLFTLTPNHAPHTIGPSGDFILAWRPVRILSASFILNSGSTNPVDLPINAHRDHEWWAANPLKSLQSSIVTDVYYDASTPNGTLNFFPVCNVANPVRLETWVNLTQPLKPADPLGFVQGYWDAIVLSLALRLCPAYQKEAPPTLVAMQREAMKIIMDNNNPPPRIDTSAGMPGSGSTGRPDFNFLTGLRE